MANVIILVLSLLVVTFLEFADLGTQDLDSIGVPERARTKRQSSPSPDRLKVLLDNIMAIEDHNQLFDIGEVLFRMKLNKFANLGPELFNKLVNGFRSFSRNNPVSEALRKFISQALNFVRPILAAIGGSVDWRLGGADWIVRDQEECASCWAICTIGAIEGQILISTGRLVRLSPQNLIDCARMEYGGRGCDGGSMIGAYMYARDNGLNTAMSYPYVAQDGICRHDPLMTIRVKSYRKIQEGNETELMEAVATVGPIAAGMDASLRSFQFYSRGIYYDPLCSSTNMNHGVLVVGYGTTVGGIDYWVIKNSYGSDWGEGGYFKLARNKNNHCGIATQATYPVL